MKSVSSNPFFVDSHAPKRHNIVDSLIETLDEFTDLFLGAVCGDELPPSEPNPYRRVFKKSQMRPKIDLPLVPAFAALHLHPKPPDRELITFPSDPPPCPLSLRTLEVPSQLSDATTGFNTYFKAKNGFVVYEPCSFTTRVLSLTSGKSFDLRKFNRTSSDAENRVTIVGNQFFLSGLDGIQIGNLNKPDENRIIHIGASRDHEGRHFVDRTSGAIAWVYSNKILLHRNGVTETITCTLPLKDSAPKLYFAGSSLIVVCKRVERRREDGLITGLYGHVFSYCLETKQWADRKFENSMTASCDGEHLVVYNYYNKMYGHRLWDALHKRAFCSVLDPKTLETIHSFIPENSCPDIHVLSLKVRGKEIFTLTNFKILHIFERETGRLKKAFDLCGEGEGVEAMKIRANFAAFSIRSASSKNDRVAIFNLESTDRLDLEAEGKIEKLQFETTPIPCVAATLLSNKVQVWNAGRTLV